MRTAILVVLCTLLAGCGTPQAAPDPSGDDYNAYDDFDLDAAAGFGIIRGVVVDGSIVPVAGATVTLQGKAREATTNSEGAFGFGNVSAGLIFIKVQKFGFLDKTVEVPVVADESQPDVVKVQLEVDPSAPFVEDFPWVGFVQCSLSGIPACRPAAFIGAQDESMTVHDLSAGPQWVQSEMHWTGQQQVSDELWLWHAYGAGDEPGFGAVQDRFGDVQGESPLILATSRATAEAAGQVEAFDKLGLDHELMPIVFGGSIPETRVLCGAGDYCGGVGFTFEQTFTVYTHAFYRFQPPEDWVFSRDGIPNG